MSLADVNITLKQMRGEFMNRLKELREKNNLTLRELGEKVNMSSGRLSQYETGKRNPKLETWQKLADFFGVPVSYLQGTDDTTSLRNYFIHTNNFIRTDTSKISADNLITYITNGIEPTLTEIKKLIDELTLIRAINRYLDNKDNGVKPIYTPATSDELNNLDYLKKNFSFLFDLAVKEKDIQDVISNAVAQRLIYFNRNDVKALIDEVTLTDDIFKELNDEVNKELAKYPSKVFFDGAKDFILNKQFDDRTNNLTNNLFITLMAVLAKLDKRDDKDSIKK